MAFETNHHLRHAEIGDLRRGMPSGTGGQFIALHQNHIAPTLLGQMIKG